MYGKKKLQKKMQMNIIWLNKLGMKRGGKIGILKPENVYQVQFSAQKTRINCKRRVCLREKCKLNENKCYQ